MTTNEREAFEKAFPTNYQWSESNKNKAFFGWQLARDALDQRQAFVITDEMVGGALVEFQKVIGFVPITNEKLFAAMRAGLQSMAQPVKASNLRALSIAADDLTAKANRAAMGGINIPNFDKGYANGLYEAVHVIHSWLAVASEYKP